MHDKVQEEASVYVPKTSYEYLNLRDLITR